MTFARLDDIGRIPDDFSIIVNYEMTSVEYHMTLVKSMTLVRCQIMEHEITLVEFQIELDCMLYQMTL